jgi:transposase
MYVGLDLAKESIVGTAIDSRGNLIRQKKFRNGPEEIGGIF